jgi:hypothetical protein
VLALQLQGFLHLDPRHVDVAEAERERITIGIVAGCPFYPFVIDPQFLSWLNIVKHRHPATADDGEASHLVGIKPTDMAVRQESIGKSEGKEDNILNAALQVG